MTQIEDNKAEALRKKADRFGLGPEQFLMRYLSISEILELHERILASSGGDTGIRDLDALESGMILFHGSGSTQPVSDGDGLKPAP